MFLEYFCVTQPFRLRFYLLIIRCLALKSQPKRLRHTKALQDPQKIKNQIINNLKTLLLRKKSRIFFNSKFMLKNSNILIFMVLSLFACKTYKETTIVTKYVPQEVVKHDTIVIYERVPVEDSMTAEDLEKKDFSNDEKIVEAIENTPSLAHNFTGFALYDPENDEWLCQYNANKYFTPASCTKLFTLYSALKILGDSIPALKYIESGDSLIFSGTGDPTFLSNYYGRKNSKVYNFLKNSNEKLYYSPQSSIESSWGRGWAWDDFNEDYCVERAVFPIYDNLVRFEVARKKIISVTPSYFNDFITSDIVTRRKETPIKRDIGENNFVYYSNCPLPSHVLKIPFKYSDNVFVRLLSDTLNKGVATLYYYPKFQNYNTLYSIATDELLQRMIRISDNYLAEQTLLLCSSKFADTVNTGTTIKYMMSKYLNDLPDRIQWVDGSGLSRYNLMTPRVFVSLLKKMYFEFPQERIFNIMAVGGVSGTIRNWYKADKPYIYAKTGTFSNNHTLCGYVVTKSGKVLIFSFMHNNYMCEPADIKRAMQKILWQVHLNY